MMKLLAQEGEIRQMEHGNHLPKVTQGNCVRHRRSAVPELCALTSHGPLDQGSPTRCCAVVKPAQFRRAEGPQPNLHQTELWE